MNTLDWLLPWRAKRKISELTEYNRQLIRNNSSKVEHEVQALTDRAEMAEQQLKAEQVKIRALARWIKVAHRLDSVETEKTIKRVLQQNVARSQVLFVMAMLMMTGIAKAQLPPILRNFFDTNPAPIVDVVAGAGINVTPSTPNVQTRRFTVIATGSTVASNVYGSNVIGSVQEASHATNADNWLGITLSNNYNGTFTGLFYGSFTGSVGGYGGYLTNLNTSQITNFDSSVTNLSNIAASNAVVVIAGSNATVVTNFAGYVTTYTVSGSAGQPPSANLTNWSLISTSEVLYPWGGQWGSTTLSNLAVTGALTNVWIVQYGSANLTNWSGVDTNAVLYLWGGQWGSTTLSNLAVTGALTNPWAVQYGSLNLSNWSLLPTNTFDWKYLPGSVNGSNWTLLPTNVFDWKYQAGSDNLTNWSALPTNTFDWKYQQGNANLTNWAAFTTNVLGNLTNGLAIANSNLYVLQVNGISTNQLLTNATAWGVGKAGIVLHGGFLSTNDTVGSIAVLSNATLILSNASYGYSNFISGTNVTFGPISPSYTSGSNEFAVNGNTLVVTSNRVGIGTSNPQYGLDVNGYVRGQSGLIGNGNSLLFNGLELSTFDCIDWGTTTNSPQIWQISTKTNLLAIGDSANRASESALNGGTSGAGWVFTSMYQDPTPYDSATNTIVYSLGTNLMISDSVVIPFGKNYYGSGSGLTNLNLIDATNYANSLGTFAQNWYVWGSSNSPGATNAAGLPYKVMQRSDVTMNPVANTNTYASPADGTYIAEVITAIPMGVTEIRQGTFLRGFYAFTSGTSLQVTPEIYIRTNLYSTTYTVFGEREIAAGTAQTINTTPQAYLVSVPLSSNVTCYATNYLVMKLKISNRVGTPNVSLVSQDNFPAYLSVPLQSADFVLRAGDTMSGSLTLSAGQFNGNGAGITNFPLTPWRTDINGNGFALTNNSNITMYGTLLTSNAPGTFINGTCIYGRSTDDGAIGVRGHGEGIGSIGILADTDSSVALYASNNSTLSGYAIWADGDYYAPTGRVMIGTTLKSHMLNVGGNIAAIGTIYATNGLVTGWSGQFYGNGAGLTNLSATNNNLYSWANLTTNAYQSVWIDAGAMATNAAGGPTVGYFTSTNYDGIYADVWKFDSSTPQTNYFKLMLPDSWDLGTVKVKFFYFTTAVVASTSNVWAVCAQAVSKGDLYGFRGTEVSVTNLVQDTTNKLNVCTSPAITVGGTPALGDMVHFQIRRVADSGWDNSAGDAWLLGVAIQYQDKRNNPAVW